MELNIKHKHFKLATIAILILIPLLFFFLLNHNLFKQNQKVKSLNGFQIETKNIHSIFVQRLKNQDIKKNLSMKKGQSLNVILSNAGVSQKEIINVSKLLQKYLNLKKINKNHNFQIIMNKEKGTLGRLTVNIDNITSLHIFKKDNEFIANKIEKVLYKKTSLSEGIIKSSLFRAAQKDNIEAVLLLNLQEFLF